MACLAAVLLGAGCATGRGAVSPEPTGEPGLQELTAPFAAAPDSRHQNLYEPESFAVFLDPEVLITRLELEAEAYDYPVDEVDEERRRIADLATQYYICEFHLVSAFGDKAVARDAVTLHGVTVWLENDAGRRSGAVGVQVGVMDSLEVGSLQVVKCTNIVLFPRIDLAGDRPLLEPTTQRVALNLAFHDSAFTAVWDVTPDFNP